MRLLDRLSRKRRESPERDAGIDYYRRAAGVTAQQDHIAVGYNRVMEAYYTARQSDEKASLTILKATNELIARAEELIRRHAALVPVPQVATSYSQAWTQAYLDHLAWATGMRIHLTAQAQGDEPDYGHLDELAMQQEISLRQAEKETVALRRTLGVTRAEYDRILDEVEPYLL